MMPARHQLIVQVEAGWSSFINKSHALLGEVLADVTEQLLGTIGQTQGLLQLLVIGKNYGHTLFVDIEAGKDIIVARHKLSGNCHRRFSGNGSCGYRSAF